MRGRGGGCGLGGGDPLSRIFGIIPFAPSQGLSGLWMLVGTSLFLVIIIMSLFLERLSMWNMLLVLQTNFFGMKRMPHVLGWSLWNLLCCFVKQNVLIIPISFYLIWIELFKCTCHAFCLWYCDNLYHFILRSVALILSESHKISGKQNLFGLLSCQVLNWSGWYLMGW